MVDFIRDDAEALMQMQYGYDFFKCPDIAYEAHRISQHEEDAAMISMEIEDNARRQTEADKFNQEVNYFLSDWSGL